MYDNTIGQPETCPVCQAGAEHLGHTGRRDVYRCRACGWTWTVDRRCCYCGEVGGHMAACLSLNPHDPS